MPNSKPIWYTRPEYVRDIADALDEVQVYSPGRGDTTLDDWYAVSTGESSIVAYFADEADACSFRLKIIDRWFNG